jgi:hypothetical protein
LVRKIRATGALEPNKKDHVASSHALSKLCILRGKKLGRFTAIGVCSHNTLDSTSSYLDFAMPSTLMGQLVEPNATTHRTWVRTGLIPTTLTVFDGEQAVPSDMLRNTASINPTSTTSCSKMCTEGSSALKCFAEAAELG